MKKKPQQCQRQGKCNTNIKSFLNNLKENDLHFEDSQITQCVFLGVLRLKPVPSVFSSNNVPSAITENKSKRFKNNNNTKEINKNVSRKKDINKVISGRIGKKNPDRIKASVKKLPTKKPVIKLKFNMNRNKKDSPSKDSQETVRIVPETLTKITPDSVFTHKAITLNPITTAPTFNPVQNLFNKLKQQLDDSYNRPSSTEVSKERLYSDLDVETQKSSRRQKKSNKKNKSGIFDRLSMPLLPSSSSSFSDNGYFSSGSLSKKPTEDVILFNEDNDDDDDCEVLLNTGPMPNFVLESRNKLDNNDIILIPDDHSDTPSPSRDLIIVDDVRSTRSSPRISKGDLNGSNISQQKSKDNLSAYGIISYEEGDQSDKDKSSLVSSKDSVDKPRRRRTLMPTTAMPSIFFNTPRLLRSELGQKKGTPIETKTTTSKSSTIKLQKSESKLEKSSVKQKKEKSDLKVKTTTENLIYEVVKSTENMKNTSEISTKSQDAVLVVDASPPKVEPLIIKLKKSAEQSTQVSDQNGNEEMKSKDKSQKVNVNKVTKNLFFPRLLRSDINQQKDGKTESVKKPGKVLENATITSSDLDAAQKIPQQQNENSAGKVTAKTNKDFSEKVQEILSENQKNVPKTPTQKSALSNVEKKIVEKTTSAGTKKVEKSPLTPRRTLRSDISQELNNLVTANNDDGQIISEISSLTPRRTLRSEVCQEQFNDTQTSSEINAIIEIIDNMRTNVMKSSEIIEIDHADTNEKSKKSVSKAKNVANDNQVQRHLRSESAQKKIIDSEIINIDEVVNQEKSKKHDKRTESMDIIDVDNANAAEENSNKVTSKAKYNASELGKISTLRSESPQKKLSDSDIIDVDEVSTFEEPVKKHSSRAKNVAVVQPMSRLPRSESPQKKSDDSESVNTEQISQSLEKTRKNVSKIKQTTVNQSIPQKSELSQTESVNVDVISVLRFYSSEDKGKKDGKPKDASSAERRQLRSDDAQKTTENKESTNTNQLDSKKLLKMKDSIVEQTTGRHLRSETQKKGPDAEMDSEKQSTKDMSKLKKINEKQVQKVFADPEVEKDKTSNIEATTARTLRSSVAQDPVETVNVAQKDVQKAVERDAPKNDEQTKTKSLKTMQKEKSKTTEQEVSEKETVAAKSDVEDTKTRALRSKVSQPEELPKGKEVIEEEFVPRTLRSDLAQKEIDTSENSNVDITKSTTDKNANNEKEENNQLKENGSKTNSIGAVTSDSKSKNKSTGKSAKGVIKIKKDVSKKMENMLKKSAKSILKKSPKEKSVTGEVTKSVNLLEVHSPKELIKIKTTSNEETTKESNKNTPKKSKNILLKAKKVVSKNRLLKAKITAAKKTANKKLRLKLSPKKVSSKSKEKSGKIIISTEKQTEKDKPKTKDVQKDDKSKPKKKLEKKSVDIHITTQVDLLVSSPRNQSKIEVLENSAQKKSEDTNVDRAKVSKPEESQKSEVTKKATTLEDISQANIIIHSRRSQKLDISTQKSEVVQKKTVTSETGEQNVKASPKSSPLKTETPKHKVDVTQKSADLEKKTIASETNPDNVKANPKSKAETLKKKIDVTQKKSAAISNAASRNSKSKSETPVHKSVVSKKKSEIPAQETNTTQKKSESDRGNLNSSTSNSKARVTSDSLEVTDNNRSNSKTRGAKPEVVAKKTEVTQKKSTDIEIIDKADVSHKKSADAEIINQLDSVLLMSRNNSKTRTSVLENSVQKTEKKSTDSKQKDVIESGSKSNAKSKKEENKNLSKNVLDVSLKATQQNKSNKIEGAKKVVKHIKKARITKVSPLETPSQKKTDELNTSTSIKSEVPMHKFEISHKRGADLEIMKQVDSLIVHSRRSTSKPNVEEGGAKNSGNLTVKTTADKSVNKEDNKVNENEKEQQKSAKQKKEVKNVTSEKTKISSESKKADSDGVGQTTRKKGIKREIIDDEVIDLTNNDKGTKSRQDDKTKSILEVIEITDNNHPTNSKNQQKTTHKSRKFESKNSKKVSKEVPASKQPAKVQTKKTTQKQQEDLDLIQVVTEKRVKKQGNNVSPKLLRSSLNPVVIKEEIVAHTASPVVEKVVALIHSEPKPKDHYEATEQTTEAKPQTAEKSKSRMLRSQNIIDIETIDIVPEEGISTKKDKSKENNKVAKKQGVSQKSKVITKKKTVIVAKKLKSVAKTKNNPRGRPAKVKNTKSINKKITTKSKLPTLSKKSKQQIIKEVKLKLKNSKKGNLLKSPSQLKTKSSGKQKNLLDWQNNVIIERIIQEIKNTIFKQEPIEDAEQANSEAASGSTKKGKDKLKKGETSKKAVKKVVVKPKGKTLKKTDKDKKKIIRAAKKKMMQTKEALKRKLRSAMSIESNPNNEGNTSNSSDSKENNPPESSAITPKEHRQDSIEHNTELVKPEEVTETPEEIKELSINRQKRSTPSGSIIIINEVSVPASSNISGSALKRKNTEPAESGTTKRKNYRSTILSRHISTRTSDVSKSVDDTSTEHSKKKDTTIFDFDESEPEVTPLRHKSGPKVNFNETPITIPEKTARSKHTTTPPEPEKPRSSSSEAVPSEKRPVYSGVSSPNIANELRQQVNKSITTISSTTKRFSLEKDSPIASSSPAVAQEKRLDRSQPGTSNRPMFLQQKDRLRTSGISAFRQRIYSKIPQRSDRDDDDYYYNPTSSQNEERLYSEFLTYSDEEEEEDDEEEDEDSYFKRIPLKNALPGKTVKVLNIDKEPGTSSIIESGDLPCQELVNSRRKLLVPFLEEDGQAKRLWSVIDTSQRPMMHRRHVTPPRQVEQHSDIFAPSTSAENTPAEAGSSNEKKSPLKQPTIIEMFSKVWMKKEHPMKSLPEDSAEDQAPPEKEQSREVFTKPLPVALPAPSPRMERCEDEDSDNESRLEWIPEEYAEYKFKYSASKMMQAKGAFKCKICMMMLPSYYRLLKHRKEHEKKEKPYHCTQCRFDFANVDEFSAHLRIHKGKHPYLCPKCDSGFWTKSAYEAHIPVHILKKPKQPVKKFRCDICAKEFSKLCDVERHTRVHTGEKPCICNICNKRFQQAHNLSKHLLTHLHIKPFHCEICNKQFGRNDVLRRHLLTHSVDKPIKCTVCHRGFIRASQLLQHMRRKHPDVPIDLSELNVDDTDGRDERLYGTDFDDHRPGSSRQMKQEA